METLVGILFASFVADLVAFVIIYRKRDVYLPRFRYLLRRFLRVDDLAERLATDVNHLANRISKVEQVQDGHSEEEYDACSDCDGCDQEEVSDECDGDGCCGDCAVAAEEPARELSTEEKLSNMIQDKLAGKEVPAGDQAKLVFEAFKKLVSRKLS